MPGTNRSSGRDNIGKTCVMAVYTQINEQDLTYLLASYELGALQSFQGIIEGVTNSNFHIQTPEKQLILTIFEQLNATEVEAYLDLMNFLSLHDVALPIIYTDIYQQPLQALKQKPAVIMQHLPGKHLDSANINHCQTLGVHLAKLHNTAKNYPHELTNQRNNDWRQQSLTALHNKLPSEDWQWLENEVDYFCRNTFDDCPRGIIHADLFRDNVLFEGTILTGMIDFYYACYDLWLLDIAIVINDWCYDHTTLDQARMNALLQAYQTIRPLTAAEQKALPEIGRLAALRFWLSRTYDQHFPATSQLSKTKDPACMKAIWTDWKNKCGS